MGQCYILLHLINEMLIPTGAPGHCCCINKFIAMVVAEGEY